MTQDTQQYPQTEPDHSTASSNAAIDYALGLAGAIVGAVVGHFLFYAIATQGFYAIAVPGALLGLGCGALSGRRSVVLGIVCGAGGLAIALYSEWRVFPFIKDGSFSYFLAHVQDLTLVSKVAIALNAGFGLWFGMGREGGTWPRQRTA